MSSSLSGGPNRGAYCVTLHAEGRRSLIDWSPYHAPVRKTSASLASVVELAAGGELPMVCIDRDNFSSRDRFGQPSTRAPCARAEWHGR